MNEVPTIEIIDLSLLRRSPNNPRKNFDMEKLKQLSDNIREHGMISALVVRPAWCIGWSGGERPSNLDESFYEIVAGERRYRASLLAEHTEAPVTVRELSDRAALELQLIENLQRDDLSALEEAEGIQAMLELRDESGEPVYTVSSISKTVNISPRHLWNRLKLLSLPDFAKEMLKKGEVSASLCEIICKVPDPAQREKAADEIIYGSAAMPVMMSRDAARAHILAHYQKSTKGAEFDPADETLLPDVGACHTCPFYGANAAPGEHAAIRADMCTNTACFARKDEAARARWTFQNSGKNRRVLTPEENELAVYGDHFVFFKSKIVGLDEEPNLEMRAGPGVEKKTWRELVKGRDVELVIGRTRKGKPIEGAKIDAAVAAAILNGHSVKDPSAPRNSAEKKEEKRQRESMRERNLAVVKRVSAALQTSVKADSNAWLKRALTPLVEVELDGLIKVLGKSRKDVMVELESGVPSRLCALAASTLLLHFTDHDNAIRDKGLAMLKELNIDEKAIRKEVLAAGTRKVLIDPFKGGYHVAIKVSGKVTDLRTFTTDAGLIAHVKSANAGDVIIDSGFESKRIEELAEKNGWRAIRGTTNAKEVAEIEDATAKAHKPDLPKIAAKPVRKLAKKSITKKLAKI